MQVLEAIVKQFVEVWSYQKSQYVSAQNDYLNKQVKYSI